MATPPIASMANPPQPRLCCMPPPISPTIRLDKKDLCYLYRAINQDETDLAIQWMDKWKDEALVKATNRSMVLWDAIRNKNETVIEYMVKHELVTEKQVCASKKEWIEMCGN